MNTRKFAIGCGITALVVIVGVIITAVVLFSHLRAPVQLQEPAPLLDAGTLGFAVVRLQPDNPWIASMLERLNSKSFKRSDPEKIFPLQMMWLAQRHLPDQERQSLAFSMSPGGKFLGWVFDFTLWKIGRTAESGASRVVYANEGITSFPDKKFKGCVFVRGNVIVWSSDQPAAERMVDRLNGAPATDADGAPLTQAVAVLELMPEATTHLMAGAVINENGALLRSLGLATAKAADLPPAAMNRIASAAVVLDVASAADASGTVTLRFAPGVSEVEQMQTAQMLAAWIPGLRYADMTIVATPSVAPDKTTIAVQIAGLDTIQERLLGDLESLEDTLRDMEKGELPKQ